MCGILVDLSWQEDQGNIWAESWDREKVSQLTSNIQECRRLEKQMQGTG